MDLCLGESLVWEVHCACTSCLLWYVYTCVDKCLQIAFLTVWHAWEMKASLLPNGSGVCWLRVHEVWLAAVWVLAAKVLKWEPSCPSLLVFIRVSLHCGLCIQDLNCTLSCMYICVAPPLSFLVRYYPYFLHSMPSCCLYPCETANLLLFFLCHGQEARFSFLQVGE